MLRKQNGLHPALHLLPFFFFFLSSRWILCSIIPSRWQVWGCESAPTNNHLALANASVLCTDVRVHDADQKDQMNAFAAFFFWCYSTSIAFPFIGKLSCFFFVVVVLSGMVLMGISEVHRKVFFEWEDNVSKFFFFFDCFLTVQVWLNDCLPLLPHPNMLPLALSLGNVFSWLLVIATTFWGSVRSRSWLLRCGGQRKYLDYCTWVVSINVCV